MERLRAFPAIGSPPERTGNRFPAGASIRAGVVQGRSGVLRDGDRCPQLPRLGGDGRRTTRRGVRSVWIPAWRVEMRYWPKSVYGGAASDCARSDRSQSAGCRKMVVGYVLGWADDSPVQTRQANRLPHPGPAPQVKYIPN